MRAAALLCALATIAPAQDEGDPQAEAERLYTAATSGSPRIRYQAALRLAQLGETGAAIAEKSAAKRAAIAQAKADKQAAAKAKAEADAVPAPTEAELKAARDAKYAARKKRKKG